MKCPACGSRAFVVRYPESALEAEAERRTRFAEKRIGYKPDPAERMDLTDFMHGSVGRMVTCTLCGLALRQEDEVADYSADHYDPLLLRHLYPSYRDAFRRKAPGYAELLRPRAEVVEVGSHLGAFLEVAEDWGWRPTGLDIGWDTSAFARRQGMRVRRETLEDTRLRPHSADAVFLWNCFEQLEEPRATLLGAHRILDRNGLLVVRTPNFAFYEQHRGKRIKPLAYNNLLGFPYKTGYTPEALVSSLENNGFTPLAGFDSALLTLPISYKSARVEREEERASRYESMAARAPEELSGPWIEIVCRRSGR